MRLSPVWVAIAAIASFRQVMLTQMPATYATPATQTVTAQGKQFKNQKLIVRSQKSGVRSQKSEVRSQESGVRTSFSSSVSSASAPSAFFPDSRNSSRQALIATLKGKQNVAPPKLVAKASTLSANRSDTKSSSRNNLRNPIKQGAAALKPQAIAQLEQDTAPETQIPVTPNPNAPDANTAPPITEPATPPTVPVQPAPGTESLPQQETPNRIQVPLTPNGAPAPGSVPNQPNPPIPPSTPAPEQTQPPTDALPPAPAQPGAPGDQPAPDTQPEATPEAAEPRVLVAEVAVSSETGTLPEELQNEIYQAIRTTPGRTTTRSQLQEDINAIFATGFFANVRAIPEDTPLGVRVAYIVQPNPTLQRVQIEANPSTNVPSVLPPKIVEDIFKPQYGSILNFRRLQEGIKQLNQWYQKNGYVLAQAIAAPKVAPDGTVTLQVTEGVVEDIQIRFVREGEATDDEGKPIRGRTRDFIITRELALRPNTVFNRNVVQSDLQRVYGLGIFEDVNVALNPGKDPRQVVVVLNVD